MINVISAADITFIMLFSLWTWHDKCNICCRYYIYHVKFNVCLVTKPLGVFSSEAKWLKASLLFLMPKYLADLLPWAFGCHPESLCPCLYISKPSWKKKTLVRISGRATKASESAECLNLPLGQPQPRYRYRYRKPSTESVTWGLISFCFSDSADLKLQRKRKLL